MQAVATGADVVPQEKSGRTSLLQRVKHAKEEACREGCFIGSTSALMAFAATAAIFRYGYQEQFDALQHWAPPQSLAGGFLPVAVLAVGLGVSIGGLFAGEAIAQQIHKRTRLRRIAVRYPKIAERIKRNAQMVPH